MPGISLDGHHTVYIECDISPVRKKQKPSKIHFYKITEWHYLKEHMRSFCAQFITDSDTPVNDVGVSFKKELLFAVDKYVPSKMTNTTPKAP